jgi:hypothetical protein
MPTTTNFDTLFPLTLTGAITILDVKDSDGTPNRVLEIDRSWSVAIDWRMVGTNADTIAGTWKVSLRVESMGSGIEGEVASTTIDLITVQAGSNPSLRLYHADLTVPAGKIDEPGVYKPVLLITYFNMAGSPRPMAGFSEFPLITFYKDQP